VSVVRFRPEAPIKCGCSSSGRAPPCQGGGSGFEPRHPLQLRNSAVTSQSSENGFTSEESIPDGIAESSVDSTTSKTATVQNSTSKSSKANTETSSEAKKSKQSTSSNGAKIVTTADGLTYVDGVLIANKTYSLPSDYNPGVDSTAKGALNKMIAAAKKDGITLTIVSGFRSYSTQKSIYNNYVSRDGKAEADRYSARPGYSEHQTGLAFDMNSLSQSFENTPEGKWLAANCYKYGFIIRYQKSKESITGYMYEPWHVRYLGTELAEKVYDSGLCLEEYFGITSQY
jgi:LAS superfamily LD-carboxypeptidase LdcB